MIYVGLDSTLTTDGATSHTLDPSVVIKLYVTHNTIHQKQEDNGGKTPHQPTPPPSPNKKPTSW